MNNIFSNNNYEEPFTRDGYIIVDFFNQDEVNEIREKVLGLGYDDNNEIKFRKSVNEDTAEMRKTINELFHAAFQSAIDRHLKDYKTVRIGIYNKLPGGGPTKVHWHVTLIDESRYMPLAAWIPVVDTTVKMGTLFVVKGSHNVFKNPVRPLNDTGMFQWQLSQKMLRKHSTPMLLKAGQGVIFDEKLIHWSPSNKSNLARTAFQVKLFPGNCDDNLDIYYRVNNRQLLNYRTPQDTYLTTDLVHEMPDANKIHDLRIIKDQQVIYNDRQFEAMMKKAVSNSPGGPGHYLKQIFNF